MNRPLRLTLLWLPVVAYGSAVYYFSSLPGALVATAVPDYLLHPLEYLGLTLFILRALNEDLLRPLSSRVQFAAVALSLIHAVSDEIHQLSVPRRTASVKDVIGDTLGAVLAVGVAEMVQRMRSGGRRRPNVTLYSRRECHLCREAKEALARIAGDLGLEVTEVDIGSDPHLEAIYGREVPVIVADGKKISKLAVDRDALRRRLTRLADRGA